MLDVSTQTDTAALYSGVPQTAGSGRVIRSARTFECLLLLPAPDRHLCHSPVRSRSWRIERIATHESTVPVGWSDFELSGSEFDGWFRQPAVDALGRHAERLDATLCRHHELSVAKRRRREVVELVGRAHELHVPRGGCHPIEAVAAPVECPDVASGHDRWAVRRAGRRLPHLAE